MIRSPAVRGTVDGTEAGTSRRISWLPARRWRLLLSCVAMASLVAVGLAPAPSQAQATVCTSSLTGVSVSGDIEVPAGEACTLTNVAVPGNATVGAGADLFLIESNVSGALIVTTSAFAQVTGSTISVQVSLVDAFGLLVENSTLSSGVAVNGGLFFSTASNLSGSVTSSNGWTFIEAGQVSTNVITVGDQASDLSDVSMSGQFQVDAATNGSVVCRSSISGQLLVTNSGGLVQIGGDQPVADCGSNLVNGEIRLEDNNAGDIVVANNLVFGNVNCFNNTPAPTGSGNMVNGSATGQCAGLGAGSAPQAAPLAEPASQEDRRQAILAVLGQRADLG